MTERSYLLQRANAPTNSISIESRNVHFDNLSLRVSANKFITGPHQGLYSYSGAGKNTASAENERTEKQRRRGNAASRVHVDNPQIYNYIFI